jgi:hypothetical protein
VLGQTRRDLFDERRGRRSGIATRPDHDEDDGRRVVEEDAAHDVLGGGRDVLGRWQVDAHGEAEPPAGGSAERHRDERGTRHEAEQHG